MQTLSACGHSRVDSTEAADDARKFGLRPGALGDYSDSLNRIFKAFHQANPAGRVIALEEPHLLNSSRFATFNKGSDAIVDSYNSVLVEPADGWGGVATAVLDVITAGAKPQRHSSGSL